MMQPLACPNPGVTNIGATAVSRLNEAILYGGVRMYGRKMEDGSRFTPMAGNAGYGYAGFPDGFRGNVVRR